MSDVLEDFVLGLGAPGEPPGVSVNEAGLFMVGLKKLAMEEPGEAPEGALEEASEEAAPGAIPGSENGFVAPTETVVNQMAGIVSCCFKLTAAYAYYREAARGPGRSEVENVCQNNTWTARDDSNYLLRRMAVLIPGGVPIPVPPMPRPMADPASILQELLAAEQQNCALLKQLRPLVGDSPMHFTLGQMIGAKQKCIDTVEQATIPEQTPAAKMASAIRLARAKLASVDTPKPGPGSVVVPDPGSEPIEQYAARDMQMALLEAQGVAQSQTQRAQQLEQQSLAAQNAAASASAEAQQAQAQAQQSDAAAQQAQQETQAASQQAQQAQESAASSQENAAQQADAKMRLAMRIQQFRQQLADIVSQDPVQEEGVGFGEEAGPGAPVTASQEQQAQEEQQAQAEGAPVSADAAKEQQQAARADDEAAQQEQQAQVAQQAPGAAGAPA